MIERKKKKRESGRIEKERKKERKKPKWEWEAVKQNEGSEAVRGENQSEKVSNEKKERKKSMVWIRLFLRKKDNLVYLFKRHIDILMGYGVVAIEKGAFWLPSTSVTNFTYLIVNVWL